MDVTKKPGSHVRIRAQNARPVSPTSAIAPTGEVRLRCECGENIIKKGVVRNKILVLEPDGSAAAICPRCCAKIPIFKKFEMVKGR